MKGRERPGAGRDLSLPWSHSRTRGRENHETQLQFLLGLSHQSADPTPVPAELSPSTCWVNSVSGLWWSYLPHPQVRFSTCYLTSHLPENQPHKAKTQSPLFGKKG